MIQSTNIYSNIDLNLFLISKNISYSYLQFKEPIFLKKGFVSVYYIYRKQTKYIHHPKSNERMTNAEMKVIKKHKPKKLHQINAKAKGTKKSTFVRCKMKII